MTAPIAPPIRTDALGPHRLTAGRVVLADVDLAAQTVTLLVTGAGQSVRITLGYADARTACLAWLEGTQLLRENVSALELTEGHYGRR
jgi:hypothetical protein